MTKSVRTEEVRKLRNYHGFQGMASANPVPNSIGFCHDEGVDTRAAAMRDSLGSAPRHQYGLQRWGRPARTPGHMMVCDRDS